MTTPSAAVEVYVACADHAEADRIGAAAVEKRLAACAQHWPVSSVYRWNGSVERATEHQLALRTTADLFDPLCALIVSLHSYDLPAITMVPVLGTGPGCDAWLRESTGATPPEPS